jgi:hypothetical protein
VNIVDEETIETLKSIGMDDAYQNFVNETMKLQKVSTKSTSFAFNYPVISLGKSGRFRTLGEAFALLEFV